MESKYNHKQVEQNIIKKWKESGVFKTKLDKNKKPYTIVLPPPNASGKMHIGNALMIAIEDILIRYKRMKGFNALWIPGTDHAGFETQTTYERKLKKDGKTRFDFDRQTLYQNIWDFVQENKTLIETQIDSMGASVDWSRYVFTLDPKSVETVHATFKKMVEDGLIYRDDYLVNYSFKWGTTFSDAEIVYKEQVDTLYYIKYPFADKEGYITVATVRPEPIFVDTHLAVNPEDPEKKHLIGEFVLNPLTKKRMEIIGDTFVDPAFGTGIVKMTPAHDKTDYEVARKHNLPIIAAITLEGRMNENCDFCNGLRILEARKKVVEYFNEQNLIEKLDENYKHVVPADYRSGDYIENLIIPNWFVNVDHPTMSLKAAALAAITSKQMRIYPKWREITYKRWVENMHDWAISRQIVWGIQIPAWYNVDENPNLTVVFRNARQENVKGTISELLKDYSIEEIRSGIQNMFAPKDAKYIISSTSPGERYIQDTDTFDTWFSSGQWPLITTNFPDSEDFQHFYPTAVLETGWEIVTRWVSRMVMFGCYLTGSVPFKDVYLHGHVRARDGRKMSKSLGNVINPEDYMDEFGTDALRMGLIAGTANGKDFSFPHDKILGYRNFANKIWNMTRFTNMIFDKYKEKYQMNELNKDPNKHALTDIDKEMINKFHALIQEVEKNIEKYRFADGAEAIYQFMWKELASEYIEHVKTRTESIEEESAALATLHYILSNSLKVLHPFMPFVTEEIWEHLPMKENTILAAETWPSIQ